MLRELGNERREIIRMLFITWEEEEERRKERTSRRGRRKKVDYNLAVCWAAMIVSETIMGWRAKLHFV